MDWKDSEGLKDFIYRCTLGAGCDMQCLRNNELRPTKVIEALRAEAMEKIGVLPEHREYLESTKKYANPFAATREARLEWTKDLGFELKDLSKKKGEVLLYVGCMYSLEPRVRDTIKSTARVLNAAGVDFGFLGAEEECCGLTQLQIGERLMFEELARKNIKMFNGLGIKTLATPCPHCYESFKNYYPEMGEMNFEVLHITEYLNRLISEGKIRLEGLPGEVVTYHDPCHLGRKVGVYDAPREVIKSVKGIELREMERIKDQSWCCGAGGGVLAAYPDFARKAAEERVEEAEATGASAIVTACPWCEYNLETGIEARKSKMRLYDVAEIVDRSMKGE
jgi:Fe-S oxidoreductase